MVWCTFLCSKMSKGQVLKNFAESTESILKYKTTETPMTAWKL